MAVMTGAKGICGATSLLLSVAALGAVTLFDFEDGKSPEIRARTYSVGVTNAFATSGMYGLRFRCDRWKKGMPEWPSFNLISPVRDWSGYDRLVIDVVSLGDAIGDHIGTFLAGPQGRIQNGLNASLRLPSRRWRLAPPRPCRSPMRRRSSPLATASPTCSGLSAPSSSCRSSPG